MSRRLLLVGCLVASVSGCAVYDRPYSPYGYSDQQYVYEGSQPYIYASVAPPPAQVEVIPVAPSPAHVWAPGYWRWHGHGHVWVNGYWNMPPRRGVVWDRGGWAPHPQRGWAYRPGRWR